MKRPTNKAAARRSLKILPQPTESTCGPTCLHAVYDYLDHPLDLQDIIAEVPEHENGGTFSVILALHALRQGFETTIYSYNIRTFDPSWEKAPPSEICAKLEKRLHRTRSPKARANLGAYIEYLRAGGSVAFDELTPKLLRSILEQDTPIIAGLSSTHLYRDQRTDKNGTDDDVFGDPEGHFVVIESWNPENKTFHLADPYRKNPLAAGQFYEIGVHRLINSILLGIVTYDANLLVIKPAAPATSE